MVLIALAAAKGCACAYKKTVKTKKRNDTIALLEDCSTTANGEPPSSSSSSVLPTPFSAARAAPFSTPSSFAAATSASSASSASAPCPRPSPPSPSPLPSPSPAAVDVVDLAAFAPETDPESAADSASDSDPEPNTFPGAPAAQRRRNELPPADRGDGSFNHARRMNSARGGLGIPRQAPGTAARGGGGGGGVDDAFGPDAAALQRRARSAMPDSRCGGGGRKEEDGGAGGASVPGSFNHARKVGDTASRLPVRSKAGSGAGGPPMMNGHARKASSDSSGSGEGERVDGALWSRKPPVAKPEHRRHASLGEHAAGSFNAVKAASKDEGGTPVARAASSGSGVCGATGGGGAGAAGRPTHRRRQSGNAGGAHVAGSFNALLEENGRAGGGAIASRRR